MITVNEVTIPLSNCHKIFVQRDYSKGLGVQFEVRYPAGLEGKISEETWRNTIETLNEHYNKAEKVCCSTVMETLIGCFSCYISRIFSKTQYEKQLVEIKRFIDEQNETIYIPAGLHLTDPIERGMRVFEISILTSSAAVNRRNGDHNMYDGKYAVNINEKEK
uniref:Ras modification protein ERF4 n=1 Tax=Syphacia muris TaxID=451379 RepID=A0A0N5AGL9_9BILA